MWKMRSGMVLSLKKPGQVDIRVKESADGQYLICEIQDDGVGVQLQGTLPKMRPHSKAISITQDRLAPNGQVNYKSIIDSGKENSGTLVTLKIPKVYD